MTVNKPNMVKFGDIAETVSDTHRFDKERLIFLNTSDILQGKVLHSSYSSVKEMPGQAKKSIKKGDILFSEIRPANGRYAFIDFDADDYVVSTKLMVIRAINGVNPKYLYYYLISKPVTDLLQQLAESRSGTFPQITYQQVADLDIRLPSDKEQEQIALLAETLANKIELNRKMNETLEAIAKAIFKSWFVDFDPVHAKMAGKKPVGMDDATAALFPDSFEDSELGGIPKGWKLGSLREVVEIYDSKRIPLSSRQRAERKGCYPYYGATSIMDYVDDYIFDGTYVLVGEDGSVVRDDGTPYVQYVWGKFWANNHAHVLQPKGAVCLEHLLIFFKQVNIVPYVTGAVQAKLNQDNMNKIPFVLPTDDICKAFSANITPLYSMYRLNCDQIQCLTETRDLLLPKLISGEIELLKGD